MRYDYECEKCGVVEVEHSIKESRSGRLCSTCNCELLPLISGGSGILLTGRPAWAYNDTLNAAKISEEQKGNAFNKTTVTEKRDGNNLKGKKVKIDKTIGSYNSQW